MYDCFCRVNLVTSTSRESTCILFRKLCMENNSLRHVCIFVLLFHFEQLTKVSPYFRMSIFTFLSWTTFIGGILILIGCGGYGYCVFKGEKPQLHGSTPKELDLSESFESDAFDTNSKGSGLLSDYQNV